MTSIEQYIKDLPQYGGIFILMLSTFLIGYFAAIYLKKSSNRKTIERLKKEVNVLKSSSTISNIDTIFTEIKPKIEKMVQQSQEKQNIEVIQPEKIAEKRKTQYIDYHKEKPQLNFGIIGTGSRSTKDDLTKIEGIGPYIEQRLNEIGIFNFNQISKFKPSDIRTVTELIDFFPERIERDNWVEQARGLNV